MRVKKTKIAFVMFFWLMALLVFPGGKSEAAELNMSQRILPVCFVYLNEGSSIERIWSNVGAKDDAYAVVFFDTKKKTIPSDENLLAMFADKKTESALRNHERHVKFMSTENGLEEIETIV